VSWEEAAHKVAWSTVKEQCERDDEMTRAASGSGSR
jgi:cation transport regulator ChaB